MQIFVPKQPIFYMSCFETKTFLRVLLPVNNHFVGCDDFVVHLQREEVDAVRQSIHIHRYHILLTVYSTINAPYSTLIFIP